MATDNFDKQNFEPDQAPYPIPDTPIPYTRPVNTDQSAEFCPTPPPLADFVSEPSPGWKALEVGDTLTINGHEAHVTRIDLEAGVIETAQAGDSGNPTLAIGTQGENPYGEVTELRDLPEFGIADVPFGQGFITYPPKTQAVDFEMMQRMFEPMPFEYRVMFRPGDKIKSKRGDLFGWIPVGAEGIIKRLENPESAMASKGRDYEIEFDLTPFKIPLDPELVTAISKQFPDQTIPEFRGKCITNLGCNDIEIVSKGESWGREYRYEWETDQMTFDLWMQQISDRIWDKLSDVVETELRKQTPNGSE